MEGPGRAVLLLSFLVTGGGHRCPPRPANGSIDELGASKFGRPATSITSCGALSELDSSKSAVSESMCSCEHGVVNLGLEKTGTTEVASLLRTIGNITSSSPRGVRMGIKLLRNCLCDPEVFFVLSGRSLLPWLVSKLGYHGWTCEPDPRSGIRGPRCGGEDLSCCWKWEPDDTLQGWVQCREEYHQIIARHIRIHPTRFLIVDLAREVGGERRPSLSLTDWLALFACPGSIRGWAKIVLFPLRGIVE